MKITVVLNGGLKSCCSTYPTEMIRDTLTYWFKDTNEIEVEVVDKKEENWPPDSLAALAYHYFGDGIYPLVYVENTLATIGTLPPKNSLLAMATNQVEVGITEQDIIEAAKRYGVVKEG